jgi:Leucine-rich repeat (LRR) protein
MISRKMKILINLLCLASLSTGMVPRVVHADDSIPPIEIITPSVTEGTTETGIETTTGSAIGLEVTPGVTVAEATYSSDPSYFSYMKAYDGVFIINGYTGPGGDIIVPNTLDGNEISAIGVGAFKENTTITSIVLPSGLKRIEGFSFYGCTGLKDIVIPEGVTKINASTFTFSGIESITLPDSLTSLSEFAFVSCFNLKSIIIPEGVANFADTTFSGCSALTNITFKNDKACNGNDAIALPIGAVITGKVPSYAQTYATRFNRTFVDMDASVVTPPVIVTPQPTGTPIERFNAGGDVVISELFADLKLANYFVTWIKGCTTTVGVLWDGTVNSTINQEELKYAINWRKLPLDAVGGGLHFGAPNLGITSLEGIEIFNNYTGNINYMNFSKNKLTTVKGLETLTEIYGLDLSYNHINDISGLSNLTRVYDFLNLSFNKVTSLSSFNSNLLIKNPDNATGWYGCSLDVRYNYIKDVYNELKDHSYLAQTLYLEQNGFEFRQAIKPLTATVNHNEFGTGNYLDSQMLTVSQVIGSTKTYYSKTIEGYKVRGDETQTQTINEISYANPCVWLTRTGIDARPGMVSDYTFVSSDDSIVTYEAALNRLNPLKAGDVNISVFENGVFLGVYPMKVLGTELPNPEINFLYDKVQPIVKNIYVHYKYSDGTTALPDKIIPNTVINKSIFETAPIITGYDVNNANQLLFINDLSIDYNMTFVYTAKPAEVLKYNLHVDAMQTDMVPIPVARGRELISFCGFKEYTMISNEVLKATSDDKYTFVRWGVRDRLLHSDLWGSETTYTGTELPLTIDKDTLVVAYFDILPPVVPPIVPPIVEPPVIEPPIILPPIVNPVIKGTINVIYKDTVNDIVIKSISLTDQTVGEVIEINAELTPGYTLTSESTKTITLVDSTPVTVIFNYVPIVVPTPEEPIVIPPIVVPEPPVVVPPIEVPTPEEPIVAPPIIVPTPEEPIVIPEPPVVVPPIVVPTPELPIVVPPIEVPPIEVPIPEVPVLILPIVKPTVEQTVTIPYEKPLKPLVQTYNLKIQVLGKGFVTAEPIKTEYTKGEVVKFDVLASNGWRYTWCLVNGVEFVDVPSIKMNSDKTVVINFEELSKPIKTEFRSGTVYGVIRGKDGKAVEGVLVELHSEVRKTYSNSKGEYRFDNVELGEHTVTLKNPYTLEEIAKIEVVTYDESENPETAVYKVVDIMELVKKDVSLSAYKDVQRIDFSIDLKSGNNDPVAPIEQVDPIKKKPQIPIIPVAFVTPLLILLGFLKKKNITVHDSEGKIIKKLHVKIKPTTYIDISRLKGEEFKIVFRKPSSFRKVDLQVKTANEVMEVVLQDKENSILVNLKEKQ